MKIRIELKIKGKLQVANLDLPEKWDDVPANLYPNLASIYLAEDNQFDAYAKTVRAFALLAWSEWKIIEQLKPDELIDLLPLIDWVFNKLDLQKNLQPAITINNLEYAGPADGMDNLRFAEWCAADTFMVNYTETQDVNWLHQLAAVLYRPAGIGDEYTPGKVTYRGDTREKFNDNLLKERSALMATLPANVIQGIYLFFASCRAQIIGMYPVTFPFDKTKTADQVTSLSKDGWLDIYDDLGADPRYAGPDILDEKPLHSVLFSIERNNIKMNKLKEEYDI
jgi:hypothetical protein